MQIIAHIITGYTADNLTIFNLNAAITQYGLRGIIKN